MLVALYLSSWQHPATSGLVCVWSGGQWAEVLEAAWDGSQSDAGGRGQTEPQRVEVELWPSAEGGRLVLATEEEFAEV